jgi:glycosyltransferase involved in cell wall biosynthesis
MRVAMLLYCGSFEGFFGRVLGQTRETYLRSYRNDWHWYYARALKQNGIEPIIYMPAANETGLYQTDEGIPVRFLKLSNWFRPFDQLLVKQMSRQSKVSRYIEERLNTMAFIKPLTEGLAEDRVDCLYVQEHWTGRFDYLVQNVDLPVAGSNHGTPPWSGLQWFKAEALSKSAICYTQTNEERELIMKMGGRAKLQTNGCDLGEFFPDPAIVRSKNVLTIARLTNKQKRTSDLIEAMARLSDEWTLDIVGSGPDLEMLQQLAHKAKVASRVRFHGFVSRARIRELLRSCGVYAMPSDNEAVAIAALEAMACGAAVVLSEIPTFSELVEDGLNGYLAPVGNQEMLAKKILLAWENRDRLGRAALATVQERYDSRKLYAELAHSLLDAAQSWRTRVRA